MISVAGEPWQGAVGDDHVLHSGSLPGQVVPEGQHRPHCRGVRRCRKALGSGHVARGSPGTSSAWVERYSVNSFSRPVIFHTATASLKNWESVLKPTSESELRPTFGSEVRQTTL